jgi:DhnA family fructose-bisphosphate aldolase class Ia
MGVSARYVMSNIATGLDVRIGRLYSAGSPLLILTLDGLLIYRSSVSAFQVMELADRWAEMGGSAVLAFIGTLDRLAPRQVRIASLTASTTENDPLRKVQIGSVNQAIRHGADLVAAQVHIGSSREQEMLETLGRIVSEAETLAVPVLGIAYARRESPASEPPGTELASFQIHAARTAVELGVHLVKVQMLGDSVAMKDLVQACAPTPVLIAGGDLENPAAWMERVESNIDAGVSGVCVGRNVTDRDDSGPILDFLSSLRST